MKPDVDVIIVGGGLAGLTAALDLVTNGHNVLVFEKEHYPHHKVCGEYVSNEIAPYLKRLGVSLEPPKAVAIDYLKYSTLNGNYTETRLPLGGRGISRYAFDETLYLRAKALGVFFVFQSVSSIFFQDSIFKLVTDKNETYTSTIVVGAYGKRSILDRQLNRDFIKKKSPWMAVKAHYRHDEFPNGVVQLHNFRGGYGGLSKTETGAVNFCYLASYKSFQKEKNISSFNNNVVSQNPFLSDFLQKATPLFEKPLTIAQISFHQKQAVQGHVLMCGDTAGLIHPLCGNGMAMAVHSAKIAAELIHLFLEGKNLNRNELENRYQKEWNKAFKKRLWAGKQLQRLFLNPTLSNMALSLIVKQPRVLKEIIRITHGNPIN